MSIVPEALALQLLKIAAHSAWAGLRALWIEFARTSWCAPIAIAASGAAHRRRRRVLLPPCAFDDALAVFDYRFPVDRLVHRFKFAGDLAVGRWLARRLGPHRCSREPPISSLHRRSPPARACARAASTRRSRSPKVVARRRRYAGGFHGAARKYARPRRRSPGCRGARGVPTCAARLRAVAASRASTWRSWTTSSTTGATADAHRAPC